MNLRKPRLAFSSIIDISLPLKEEMPTYPNNPKFRRTIIRTPTPTFISELILSSHAGTHVDAPSHVRKGAMGVDMIPLTQCIGPCRVLDLTTIQDMITASDLQKARIKKGERILVKTSNSLHLRHKFSDRYIFLDGSAAEFLARTGIALFGIDALSVKQRGSSDNRPHTALLRKHIVIFEGLDLSRVRPGRYIFIGFPLRISHGDGAPARAVLLA